jgi:hypothetical protein
MYIYLSINRYKYIYECTYTYIPLCLISSRVITSCLDVSTLVYIYLSIFKSIYLSIYKHTYTYIYIDKRTYMCKHKHTYINMHIYILYIYTLCFISSRVITSCLDVSTLNLYVFIYIYI